MEMHTSAEISLSNIKQAEDMKTSTTWYVIVGELDRKIYYETQKLRTCSPEELRDIQIKIQCYESLKNVPQDIIDRESQ